MFGNNKSLMGLLPMIAVLILAATAPVRADVPSVSVDWCFAPRSNHHAVAITIKNVSGRELKVQHLGNRQAVAFVVMDDHGNVITPEGIVKVDPRHQDIVVRSGETLEHMDSQLTELAQKKGLTLPFLTGTGLFAYKLTKGTSYRVTVIYRPNAEGEGIASAEKVVTFK